MFSASTIDPKLYSHVVDVVVATITPQGVNLEIHGNEESFDQYYIGELRAQCPCLLRNY